MIKIILLCVLQIKTNKLVPVLTQPFLLESKNLLHLVGLVSVQHLELGITISIYKETLSSVPEVVHGTEAETIMEFDCASRTRRG